jgi:hypothetical protein
VLRLTRHARARVLVATALAPVVLALTATACGADQEPTGSPGAVRVAQDQQRREQLDTERRVLVVSVDGLRSSIFDELGEADLPTFARLRDEGASTLDARTAVEQTETLPDHTGMVTSRRIDADQGGHGVTWNTDEPGTTVQQAAGEPVGSLFSRAHAAGGSTALFTGKSKFSLFQRSWPQGLDRYTYDTNGARLVTKARRDLRREARTVTVLHISAPDLAGHAHGWGSSEYADAVRTVDGWLADILSTVEGKPVLRKHLTILLTADHGGTGLNHVDPTLPEDYTIPFLTWGDGVAEGADLYALNDDYRDPQDGRPGYAMKRQPVRNADVANLALDLLGLRAIPGSTVGTAQDLDLR